MAKRSSDTNATLTLVNLQLRTLSGRDELLAASGDDPYVRWECDAALVDQAWALGSAVAFLRRGHHRRNVHLNVCGPEHDAAPLLDAIVAAGLPPEADGISIDQHLFPLAQRHFTFGRGGDWDWMWTVDTPPVVPHLDHLDELDDTLDAAELLALNEIGNPTAESRPGEGATELWLGIREEGRIVAAGAMHRTGAGAPHLAGIVTHPDARGRGFGAAVTAGLTTAALERSGVSTLGMYSDNETGRRLYHRLGYRTAHAWASRGFAETPIGSQ